MRSSLIRLPLWLHPRPPSLSLFLSLSRACVENYYAFVCPSICFAFIYKTNLSKVLTNAVATVVLLLVG